MLTLDARWINTSGMGTYLQNIIPALIQEFSFDAVVLLGNEDELKRFLGDISSACKIIDMRSSMYSIREQLDYLRLIPKETDLFFATHYNIPRFFRGRMLVMVYDLMHIALPQFVPGIHRRLYAKNMFKSVKQRSCHVLTISEFTKSEMFRYLGDFCQPVTSVHLGVADKWFNISPECSPHHKPYFLYVGNIKPHKNLKVLIKAFKHIVDDVSLDLVLVGKKEGFINGDNEVSELARSLKDRVHFTGIVSQTELFQYYKHAKAFVFPSLYEGFGLPPLEAMAAGCPVIVSSAGSLPEVCGDAALYFNPHDFNDLSVNMLRILSEVDLVDTLTQRGLERAKIFTWDRCIEETCSVVRGLLARSQG